jgi:hypothetical protein
LKKPRQTQSFQLTPSADLASVIRNNLHFACCMARDGVCCDCDGQEAKNGGDQVTVEQFNIFQGGSP